MKAVLIRSPKGLVGSTPADQADFLRSILSYEPETGQFFWRQSRRGRKAGAPVGTPKSADGYLRIRVEGVRYYAHRLAWLYVYGEWPNHFIDHINGGRADNRIANLRSATDSVNAQNRRSGRHNRSTGFLGVSFDSRGKKYRASITVGGKHRHLGTFATAVDAHAAYVAAKRVLHEGCTI